MFSSKIKTAVAGLGVLGIVAGGVIATPHSANAAGHAQANTNGIIRATGKISALQSNGFTLQGAKTTYTVNLGTNTWILVAKDGKATQGTATDLTVGEAVNVAGTGTASQIDARVVTDNKVAAKVGQRAGKHGKHGNTGKLAHLRGEHATVTANSNGTLTLSSGKNNKTETVNTDAGTLVLKGGLATVADLKAGDVVNVTPRHMARHAGTTAPATTTGKVKATPTAELITVVSDTNREVLGVVKSVDGTTLTVRTLKGEQKVTVSSSAAIRSVTAGSSSAPATAALSDLKAGSRVLLYGAKAATGQTHSASVVLILAQAGK